jgi:hypothetical protein
MAVRSKKPMMQTQTKTKATIEAKKASTPAFFPDLLPPHRARPQPRQDWSEFRDSKLNHNPVGSDLGYNFGQIRVYSDAKAVARPQSCPLASATPRFCPLGGACHTCPAQVQAKLATDQLGDVFEQEADRVAGEVMMHAPGDPGPPKSPYAEKLSQVAPMIQRTAIESAAKPPVAGPIGATAETPVAAQPAIKEAAPGLILEDDEEPVHPGQMKKSDFLSQLRADICSAANAILAATGRTTDDCPYLNFWLNYYSTQSSRHLEQAIRRYAPETAGVTTARDYIALTVERVGRAVTIWATTGEITGVPAGVSTSAPPVGGAGDAAGPPAKSGGVQLKGREGGGRGTGNLQAIQSQLGSGKPLDSGVRSHMESAFGHDFSRVRVHTDAGAAGLASNLDARAFTLGRDIAFGPGEYAPGSLIGDALIAHELAHVIQQGGATTPPMHKGGNEHNALEEDADRSAVGAMVSYWGVVKSGMANIAQNAMPRLKAGLRLQRCSQPAGSRRPLMITTSDVTPRIRRTCGEFLYYFRWITNARSGFIVQEISNTYSANDCTGTADNTIAPTSHFYEAWEVDSRGAAQPEQVTPLGTVNDKWERPARPDANGTPGSQGDWSIAGKVYWTPSLDPAASFSVGAVPDAKLLRSTERRPANLGSSLLEHRVGGIWDCCAGQNKHDPA